MQDFTDLVRVPGFNVISLKMSEKGVPFRILGKPDNLGQPEKVMSVRRELLILGQMDGLEKFLDRLLAQERHVQVPPAQMHDLRRIRVIGCPFHPLPDFLMQIHQIILAR